MDASVKITKKSLKTTMRDRKVNEETLSNFLTEFESITNCRLLTSSSYNIKDGFLLTPNHFLIGPSSTSN